MKIIIFHYHLNPGGVTRIIESQVQTLIENSNISDIEVITGHCENRSFFDKLNIRLSVFPELNYLLQDNNDLTERFERIKGYLQKTCDKNAILHFHNLNLGKNPLVTLAVSRMARNGYMVVNHAHDFAEDRPANISFLEHIIENYFNEDLSDILYPDIPNYSYSVLNSHDLERLYSIGVPENRCFLLPNPVVFSSNPLPGIKDDWKQEVCRQLNINENKRLITYPIRVIRRKNIGEYVLLAGLFAKEANWVVTQPPKNPVEIKPYEKWKEFCKKHEINVIWEAGTKCDFEKLIKASDFCFTTSIQEGFGMVFMEPWLLGTAVKGRAIPMVTNDIKAGGIEFPLLYDKLMLPGNKELHEHSLEEQFEIISGVLNSKSNQQILFEQNKFLYDLLKPTDELLIKKNNEVILRKFSLETYGKKLNEIYRKVIT